MSSSNKIVSSKYHSKDWRLKNISKTPGQKDSGCEKFQRNQVELITGESCIKKNGTRINGRTLEMKTICNPMTNNKIVTCDGFDWTEDFDGIQTGYVPDTKDSNGNKILYNLKFVVGGGGAQTRSLREVYHFINTQMDYLEKNPNENILFINILDGDQSYKYKKIFNQQKIRYGNPTKCFVGDMSEFSEYWKSTSFKIIKCIE